MRVLRALACGLLLCAAPGAGCGEAVVTAPPVAEAVSVLRADPTATAGPQGGPLFELGAGEGYLEVLHDENWGTAGIHLYDAVLREAEFDVPPVLNVRFDDESICVEAGREDAEGTRDGGWHFEDDSLLGVPERARFRLHAFGRPYALPFAHVHLVHGRVADHEPVPDLPAEGPHGGTMVLLSDGRGCLELLHDGDLGTASIYVLDRMLRPSSLEAPPLLNVLMGDEPAQLVAGLEDYDGNRDGGWHFEETALIGPPVGARLRLRYRGQTYLPVFRPVDHEEEPHSHDAR